MTVFAICTPPTSGGRIAGIAVAVMGIAAYPIIVALLAKGSPRDLRRVVPAVFFVAVILSAFVGLAFGGVGDTAQDAWPRFLAATTFGVAMGAVVASRNQWRATAQLVAVGALGGSAFYAWWFLAFIFSLAASGSCID